MKSYRLSPQTTRKDVQSTSTAVPWHSDHTGLLEMKSTRLTALCLSVSVCFAVSLEERNARQDLRKSPWHGQLQGPGKRSAILARNEPRYRKTLNTCPVCAKFRRQSQQEPLLLHEVPERPWSKVAADIFIYSGEDYLPPGGRLFLNVSWSLQVEEKSTKSVIENLKETFTRHGPPVTFVSDNMPFTSHEMHEMIALPKRLWFWVSHIKTKVSQEQRARRTSCADHQNSSRCVQSSARLEKFPSQWARFLSCTTTRE